jgi:hypothetical protein
MRLRGWRSLIGLGAFIAGLCLFMSFPQMAAASTGINQDLSFEGKIVNTSTGANIPDGTYNMEFKIYNASTACNPTTGSGCTLAWTEDWLVGSSEGGITFSGGTYQVNLGATCPFSGGSCESYTNTAINWNTYPLYLSLQIGNTSTCTITTNFTSNCGGDNEMKPYILLTSTPYALNAGELGGLPASAFAQLTATQTFSGANTFEPSSNSTTAFQIQNSTTSNVLTADTTNSRVDIDSTYAAMASPTGLTTAASAVAGSLATGTYIYEVTAIDDAGGETTASTAVSQATGADTSISLYWTAVPNAAGYKIYRTAVNGGAGTEVYLTTVNSNYTSVSPYIDNGSITLGTATPPGTTTAYVPTNTSNAKLQLSLGGNGTPTGDLYVGGNIPTAATGSAETGSGSNPQGVFALGNYVYVVNEGSSTLQVFDDSNQTSPSAMNGTGTTTGATSGPDAVYVAGRYAYVVDNTTSKLMVFDVSNPANPVVVNGTGTTTGTAPKSIYVSGRYAYVTSATSDLLQIFDVSNPANPVVVGSVTVNGGEDVDVNGRYAYVASGSSTVQIIDISDPSYPIIVGSFSTGAGTDPWSVDVTGRYAYVTAEATATSDLQIFDVSNPANPVAVSTVSTGTSSNPYAVDVQDNTAYVADEGTGNISVVNIENPASPTVVGTITTAANPYDVFVDGRYVYAVSETGNLLQIFDVGRDLLSITGVRLCRDRHLKCR